MNPKKAKELIPEVAKNIPLPVSTIEDIVNFYWREVWESLTTLSEPKVHVENLGDFNIKHWSLDKEINKCYNILKSKTQKGTEKYVTGIKIKDKINLLEEIKVKVEEEQQRKEFIYEHKKINKESLLNMEEQNLNLPGSME